MAKDATAQPEQGQPNPVPPYLPFTTFDNTISGWKVVLPNRIDRSLLGSYAGGTQTLLLNALKYFGLIDTEGVPTDSLRRLIAADESERPKLLAAITRQAYPFVFRNGFDLAKTTPQELRDKFAATGSVSGETLDKAISFFTALAKAADMDMSPFVKTRQRRAGSRKSAARRAKPLTLANVGNIDVPPPSYHIGVVPPPTPFKVLFDLLDPSLMTDAEQQAVWTLLQYIKKRDGGAS